MVSCKDRGREEGTQEWKEDGDVGEAESLLSLAAKDACSPAAVRLLLDHGADPNGELVPRSFNGGYLPTCGPGGRWRAWTCAASGPPSRRTSWPS